MWLDNALRFLIRELYKFAKEVVYREYIRNLRDISIKKMTHKYLVYKLSEKYEWIKIVIKKRDANGKQKKATLRA